MIKVINARLIDAFNLELDFSDQSRGIFDGAVYLATRFGPLLEGSAGWQLLRSRLR